MSSMIDVRALPSAADSTAAIQARSCSSGVLRAPPQPVASTNRKSAANEAAMRIAIASRSVPLARHGRVVIFVERFKTREAGTC
jgi:hypothetical protein